MTASGSFEAPLMFCAYLLAGSGMLALFTRIYLWITPYDDVKEISEGHLAPAIALTGAMLGFTFPLMVASYTQAGFLDYVAWSLLSCIIQAAVFWALHWLLPRMIETNNTAGALCFSAASVCAGLINAASLLP